MSGGEFPACRHDDRLPWSVGEVNRFAREVIHAGFGRMIWVKGALTRISISGRHGYSSLKDEEGNQLRIVYFNGAAVMSQLGVGTGDEVMVCGSLDIYVPGGSFQLMVVQMVPTNSTGALMQQFLSLKEKLGSEGLFSDDRKAPLPKLPRCIAVITSIEAGKAAIHDFLDTAFKRVPALHIRLIGAKMQGEGTADNIVRILNYLNEQNSCDVVVITRGGGSMEDLWEFNNEGLVRAVAASRIPVVTAIGHQIDQTLVDFAADAVAITPTDAAVRITEYAVHAAERLQFCGQALVSRLQCLSASLRTRLTKAASAACLTNPRLLYYQQAQHLAELVNQLAVCLPLRSQRSRMSLEALRLRLMNAARTIVPERRQQAGMQSRVLLSLDPKGVLKRGYAILLNEDKRAIRRASEASQGSLLTAVVAEGELMVRVEKEI